VYALYAVNCVACFHTYFSLHSSCDVVLLIYYCYTLQQFYSVINLELYGSPHMQTFIVLMASREKIAVSGERVLAQCVASHCLGETSGTLARVASLNCCLDIKVCITMIHSCLHNLFSLSHVRMSQFQSPCNFPSKVTSVAMEEDIQR
jgi:hypothetical protein